MPGESLLTPEMNARFGDRFPDLYLTHVDILYWPVWRHDLFFTVYESIPLDALEEGLLLLIRAGVDNVERAAALLGCSKRYALEMARRLNAENGDASYLRLTPDERLYPAKLTEVAIETVERQVPVQQSVSLLRDALFGEWLSFGNIPFEMNPSPDIGKGAYRWIGPAVSADIVDDGISEKGLAETLVKEVIDSRFSVTGALEWATLWIGVYQPESGAGGRYLLFNPECEDEPLDSLSKAFEDLLLRDIPEMYFKDDQPQTSADVWNRLASRIRVGKRQEEIASDEVSLREASEQIEDLSSELREPSSESRTAGASKTTSSSEEIADLKARLVALSLDLLDQKQALAAIPRVDHIDARAHPAIVKSAIGAASVNLVMICPWIKWRVLSPLLPEIDAAMKRGCKVWIGYGMPKNVNHPDNTDPNALEELKKREKGGMLKLSHLGTHEKVLIQDEELFMNTSFNFLSYTGGDGRRESGTIQRGGVADLLEKFIHAIASAPS